MLTGLGAGANIEHIHCTNYVCFDTTTTFFLPPGNIATSQQLQLCDSINAMSSNVAPQTPELGQSAVDDNKNAQTLAPAMTTNANLFKDDLEQNPENHFLSPVHANEYYACWDSDDDDDDDGEDVEWNAGITDFALFASDRKRAQETGEPLDAKWDNMLASQADALERSNERVRESETGPAELPDLTPDTSPSLRDSAEFEQHERHTGPVPNYLTVEVRPAELSDFQDALSEPKYDLPASFYWARKRGLAKGILRVERPGLAHTRTLSGRVHVWRKPGKDMFTVGEDVDAEEEAERGELRRVCSTGNLAVEEIRGRR